MRPTFRMTLIALTALGWSSHALAADEAVPAVLEPTALAAMANMELDDAFETATSPVEPEAAANATSTTMRCKNGVASEESETCIVTADGTVAAAPAALAQH